MPVLLDGKFTVNIEGNWKSNATDLFGVLATLSMEDDPATETQIMYFCRDTPGSTCQRPTAND